LPFALERKNVLKKCRFKKRNDVEKNEARKTTTKKIHGPMNENKKDCFLLPIGTTHFVFILIRVLTN
jgi:hypothetical protein